MHLGASANDGDTSGYHQHLGRPTLEASLVVEFSRTKWCCLKQKKKKRGERNLEQTFENMSWQRAQQKTYHTRKLVLVFITLAGQSVSWSQRRIKVYLPTLAFSCWLHFCQVVSGIPQSLFHSFYNGYTYTILCEMDPSITLCFRSSHDQFQIQNVSPKLFRRHFWFVEYYFSAEYIVKRTLPWRDWYECCMIKARKVRRYQRVVQFNGGLHHS